MSRSFIAVVLILLLASCSSEPSVPTSDGGTTLPFTDAPRGTDAPAVDAGCGLLLPCDDGVPCTRDRCVEGEIFDGRQTRPSTCVFEPRNDQCSAGQVCVPYRGCVASRPCASDTDCMDSDPCTTNERCDEGGRICVWSILDGDRDGDPPASCGGRDCADNDSARHSRANEFCDQSDNNCNGQVDEGLDLQTDHENCGRCRNRCSFSSATCRAGRCSECDTPGFALCGAEGCIDVRASDLHCGMCGRVCPPGTICTMGSCAPLPMCGSGRWMCGEACQELLTNPYACGHCLTRCRSGEPCMDGVCQCGAGLTYCDRIGCVNLQNERVSCGRCGHMCRSGNCLDGMCTDGS